MKTLAERLIAEREAAGLSQTELAAKVKISQSFIAALETGRQISSAYIPEIAYILGLHAMWLKAGRGPKYIYPKGNEPTAFAVQEPGPAASHRPNVRRIYELAEQLSDEGLTKAIGYLEYLAGEHPFARKKAS